MIEKDNYSQKSARIRELAALPPDKLVEHLTALHPHISEVAPNIAPHVHSAAINAVQFLNSKLPSAGPEMLQDGEHVTSQAQKAQWLDLHKTVSDPLSVLEHVENGTINRHHLEALQSVYPELHQEMIQKAQEHLGDLKVKGRLLPYSKRLAIGKFIGSPVDSTMTPMNMQAILRAAAPNTGPEAQAQKKASGSELSQVNKVSQLYRTPDQAREAKASS